MAATPVPDPVRSITDATPSAVRRELGKVAASPQLVNSVQLCRFLTFLVEHTLEGDTASLKESLLGTEVFDRGNRYDARTDPVVRVEARRLRSKLEAYYAAEGAADEILITLPKGSYVPVFTRRAAVDPAPPPPPSPARRRRLIWLGAAGLLAALIAAALLLPRLRQPEIPPGPPSVAVLPFTNVGSDPEAEYFADGLTDELTDLLSRTQGLRVVARSSVFQYKGRTVDARGIGQQLNAGLLVEGSIRKQGQRLRISVQLVDARNGFQLWSQTMEREWKQIFAMQQEIASSIAATLRLRLAGSRGSRQTENLDAYNLYLKGRYHWNKRTAEGFQAATAAFGQAIEMDPHYAPAWAGLADSYSMLGFLNAVPPIEIHNKAADAVERALQLDESLAEAHVAQGNIRAVYAWDWPGAERSYRRALELDPDYATAHYGLSKLLATLGRLDEALPEMRHALRLDPLAMIMASSLAWELAAARRYAEADAAFRAADDLNPGFIWTHTFHAWMHEARGEFAPASEELRKAIGLSGSSTLALGEYAYALGRTGQKQEALRILEQLRADSGRHYVSPFDLSRAYEGLGRRDEAMAALARAVDDRSPVVIFLKTEPVFDPLRRDPRFQPLLKRMHLD
ncbi:MAG: tetratricopeptide repeat protein [Acidobacteria bacterium]|nr:tetratricopeptide repeat protein [Acidobacteriota bacterium]